ncbi:MAG: flavodoxin domain-containing protein [Candidatus Pacebacteria bacterium]|nr:flavodoxin domain-containing protein [Candidatus Paceibacterota bacterium]
MNIGIIYYSNTGNTLSVSETLKKALETSGNQVSLERIEVTPDNPQAESVQLVKAPAITGYDLLIFASPVHGFQPSKAMSAFLNQLEDLSDRKVVCFVTHLFPFAWMGGKPSIAKMKSLCEYKGAQVLLTGIIDWKNRKREQEIQEFTDAVLGLI